MLIQSSPEHAASQASTVNSRLPFSLVQSSLQQPERDGSALLWEDLSASYLSSGPSDKWACLLSGHA